MTLPTLDQLRQADVVTALDAHFALQMGRLAAEEQAEVLLGAALASRAVQRGHVCLDLAPFAGRPVVDAEGASILDPDGRPLADLAWPERESWLAALRGSPLIGDGGGDPGTPLVLDAAGRLYLHRYRDHEVALAERLLDRVRADAGGMGEGGMRDRGVDGGTGDSGADGRIGGHGVDGGIGDHRSDSDSGADGQRRAVDTAARLRLCVITGGPGTGKTTTVVRILATLVEQALARGERAPRAALLAPTGKAAARLTQAIRAAKGGLPADEAVRQAIPEAASTIHRHLGAFGGSGARFRHDADNPLAEDVVVVDEASMVDIALMRRLVEAVRPAARLILLGDKDQLASVEAGAVLGDICAAGLGGAVVELTHSYRFGPDSGIGRLARAIRAGDADAAIAALREGDGAGVALVEPAAGAAATRGFDPRLERAAIEGYRPYLKAVARLAAVPAATASDDRAALAAECLRLLDGFRVLCAHRRGRRGVAQLNAHIPTLLAGEDLVRPVIRFYLGRPIIITQNDYDLGLFNGDIGLVLPDPSDGLQRRAVFAGADGHLRALATARLAEHETAFALSVHKAQGSEFDAVALVLPDAPSPVLSRELLYTAVTRARRAVTIFGSEAIVRMAIDRRVERASGLTERLGSGEWV